MAIFSLHYSFVGRTTHPAGAASAYARYATRNEACTVILGERMPLDRKVYAWLGEEEQGDRKNARVIDRVHVALPIELTREQRIGLLQAYAERLTEGRAPWMAAIHDGPGDANNPHAHIIFRDRDVDTGRRVMMTTEAGSTERLREAWESEVNKALERAGLEQRVDRRTLAAQGIDREPQLHVGPGALRLAERDYEFRSAEKQVTRLIDGVATDVTVNYPEIDQGQTRFEENEARKLRNWVRAQEEMALQGPHRPEDLGRTTLQLDARYREAIRTGTVPAEDGDLITAVIREHMAAREVGADKQQTPPPAGTAELLWPMPLSASPREPPGESDELKRRKADYEKLKDEPGGEELLRARDYLNALTWDRREPAPSDGDLLAYMKWAEANRLPIPKEGRERAARRFEPETREPSEKPARRGLDDLIAGGGLAIIGKIPDSLETLFDGRSAAEVERDEKIMGEKRTIEQLTEQQQRQQEAEAAKHRQMELELYLAQRDRERHFDRGR